MNDKRDDLLVACLCAAWCTACTAYRDVLRGASARPVLWIDIEDHADLLEPLDLETFPTLLIASDDQVLFFGPVVPSASQLAVLVRSAKAGALAPIDDDEHRSLLLRVRSVLESGADLRVA